MKPSTYVKCKNPIWIGYCLITFFLLFLEAVLFLLASATSSSEVISEGIQPLSIDYSKSGTAYVRQYHLKIVRRSPTWSFQMPTYEVHIDREPGEVSYGHSAALPFALSDEDAKKCRINWTIDGVWVDQDSGHRLFVPAKAFLGGR